MLKWPDDDPIVEGMIPLPLTELEGWNKQFLFNVKGSAIEDQAVRDAVLGYMCRCLSRRRIPDAKLVIDTFNGRPVPSCGHINCIAPADWEHVH